MLARRDPFREINELNETFNRFFDHLWMSQHWVSGNVPLDLSETDEGYIVKTALPGLNPDDLDVTFSNNVLTIKGELKEDEAGDSTRVHLKERWTGPFQRSLTLPQPVDADGIQADYQAGVLSLFLPKCEEARPKRIQITPGAQPKMIEERVAETA